MIRLLADNEECPFNQIHIRESVFEYSAVVDIALTPIMPIEQFVLEINGTAYPLTPVRSVTADTGVIVITCYPAGYILFLNGLSQPVDIIGDLAAVLDALAVCSHYEQHSTQKMHWWLPALRGRSLIDRLTQMVQTVNGGCPTFHFNLAGGLWFSDILAECRRPPSSLFSGTFLKNSASTTFLNEVAGKVNFVFFDDNTFTRHSCTFMEGCGETTIYKYIIADDNITQEIAKAQAAFWRRYVANSVYAVKDVQAVAAPPGVKIRDERGSTDYIITASDTLLTAGGKSVSLDLFPTIQIDQIL